MKDRWLRRRNNGRMDEREDCRVGGWKGEKMDRREGRWVDGWMDKWLGK